MKVGTDGVLLGAWAGSGKPKRILDIGSGTGLIAIMLAQRFPAALVTGIEPNRDAISDAQFNFNHSPFAERLHLIETNLESFETDSKFDLIVSNPPFFSYSLPSRNDGRTEARHTLSLSTEELAKAAYRLTENGRFAVIYPSETYVKFQHIMREMGYGERRRVNIKATPTKVFHRTMGEFERGMQQLETAELVIEKYGRHQYSEDYVELTQDFYLFEKNRGLQ